MMARSLSMAACAAACPSMAADVAQCRRDSGRIPWSCAARSSRMGDVNGLGSIRWAGVVAAALCAFAQTARAQSDNPPAGADPTSVRVAASETIAAARAAISDPRESRAFLANTGSVIFAGVLAAAAAFVLLLFLRYGRFYAHDVFHLFPTGARRWQTAVLAAALIAAPLLLRLGVAPVFFAILIACAL